MSHALPQQQAELEMLERPALDKSKAMEYHFPGTAGLTFTTNTEDGIRTYKLAEDIHGCHVRSYTTSFVTIVLWAAICADDVTAEDFHNHRYFFTALWKFDCTKDLRKFHPLKGLGDPDDVLYADWRAGHRHAPFPPSYCPAEAGKGEQAHAE